MQKENRRKTPKKSGDIMHELSIVMEVARTVCETAEKNQVTKVRKVILQIGELSGCVPHFVHACWPAACDNTILEGTKLEIETLPANGCCRCCSKVFSLTAFKGRCPECGSAQYEMLCGKEFIIKEILCS